jgi:hypothetical protein
VARPGTRRPAPGAASPWPFVGMGAMACLLYLYLFSYTFLPARGVLLLALLWLALFVQACRWWTPRPRHVVWLPAAGLAVWLVVLAVAAA